MADATIGVVTVAACAATGAVVTPILCSMGIDPISVGSGLLGCTVAQVLLPSEEVDVWKVAKTMVGSVIVASLGTPFVMPLVTSFSSKWTSVSYDQVHALTAALLAFSAKPLVLLVRARLARWVAKKEADDVPSN